MLNTHEGMLLINEYRYGEFIYHHRRMNLFQVSRTPCIRDDHRYPTLNDVYLPHLRVFVSRNFFTLISSLSKFIIVFKQPTPSVVLCFVVSIIVC